MKTNYIKQLANATLAEGKVNEQISEFVLSSLTKSQLKEYLYYLKLNLRRETLTVVSAEELNASDTQKLSEKFGKKFFVNEVDPSIGAGLVILNNDDIIDLSVRGAIGRFIRSIS